MRIEVRGGLGRERSLKTSGDEIWGVISMGLREGRRERKGQTTNLIWCIGNADVERGELGFNYISQHDIKALLHRGTLDTLRHFGGHAGIEFYGNDFARLLEDADCQVARSRADFKNNI